MSVESNFTFALVLHNYSLRLANKTRATFSTNGNPNQNQSCFRPFSRAWRQLHVFASNSDWLVVLFTSVAIGQSNYFGFGFTTLNWKPSIFIIPFQSILCEGPIDSWLSSLISGLKQTLMDQLASVLNPAQPEPNPAPQGEGVAAPEDPPRTAGSMGRVEKSFTLDNSSEVVLLATQIELCKKIEKSLKQVCCTVLINQTPFSLN